MCIRDRSGIIRRLIDVTPTGDKVPPAEYRTLTKQIPFELGGIAYPVSYTHLLRRIPTRKILRSNRARGSPKGEYL